MMKIIGRVINIESLVVAMSNIIFLIALKAWRETYLGKFNPNIRRSSSQHCVIISKQSWWFNDFAKGKKCDEMCQKVVWIYKIQTFTSTHSNCFKVCVCVGPLWPCWWGADYRATMHAVWPQAICPHGTEKSTAPQAGRISQQHKYLWGLIFQPKMEA